MGEKREERQTERERRLINRERRQTDREKRHTDKQKRETHTDSDRPTWRGLTERWEQAGRQTG